MQSETKWLLVGGVWLGVLATFWLSLTAAALLWYAGSRGWSAVFMAVFVLASLGRATERINKWKRRRC